MTTIISELDLDQMPLQQRIEESKETLPHTPMWINFERPIEGRSDALLDEDIKEVSSPGNLSPSLVANAIYKRKYSGIGMYYTEVYSDFPLLVAAELIKRRKVFQGKTLRPRYLADIIAIYESALGHRWREKNYAPFWGVLSVSVSAALGYVDLAIELAGKYPKLLGKKKQPESLTLFLQVVSKCSVEGHQQQIPTEDIYKNIRDQWIDLLLDYYPIMLSVWESTPNFERQ
jgi:hypothetical protein